MRNKNWFWGIFFLCAAVFIIVNQLGYFASVSLISLVITIFLIPIILTSIVHLSFYGIFFPLAFLCIIYAEPLEIKHLTPWPVLLVALFLSIGFSILFGKRLRWKNKQNHQSYHSFSASTADQFDNEVDASISFSTQTKYINSQSLQKAYFSCSFGALQIYLDNAQLHPDGAEMVIESSFAGIEIYIPRTWRVVNDIHTSLSGIEEKNKQFETYGPPLTLKGSASFSGIEIIYI